MDEGVPRVVFIGRAEELAGEDRDGTILVPISCQSEGALKIFIEPVPRGPDLVIIGRSPMVHTLAAMANALGWRTTVVDDNGHPEDWSEPDRMLPALDLQAAGVGTRTAVVVATQGHYDEEALEQAVATDAGWLGVVASQRRAASLLDHLRSRGVAEDTLKRVNAPAGLNLGHVSHEEIAVAILAELVQFRAAGGLQAGADAATAPVRTEAVDPVCGMTVQVAGARHRLERGGQTFYFCCAGCLRTFEASQEETGHGDPSGERVHSSGVHR
jgi:xanthine dehydrogenase accessory factor